MTIEKNNIKYEILNTYEVGNGVKCLTTKRPNGTRRYIIFQYQNGSLSAALPSPQKR